MKNLVKFAILFYIGSWIITVTTVTIIELIPNSVNLPMGEYLWVCLLATTVITVVGLPLIGAIDTLVTWWEWRKGPVDRPRYFWQR